VPEGTDTITRDELERVLGDIKLFVRRAEDRSHVSGPVKVTSPIASAHRIFRDVAKYREPKYEQGAYYQSTRNTYEIYRRVGNGWFGVNNRAFVTVDHPEDLVKLVPSTKPEPYNRGGVIDPGISLVRNDTDEDENIIRGYN
jgi:hypothetical protein